MIFIETPIFTARLYEFYKLALNKTYMLKKMTQYLRITDESRYPFEHHVDPVVKPRGFGVFFIKSR